MSNLKAIMLAVFVLILGISTISILTDNQSNKNEDDATNDTQKGPDEDENNSSSIIGMAERIGSIPDHIIKQTPEEDPFPPILHHPLWEEPKPLPYPINTRGAEDSPYITPCGDTLYFWYTPDPHGSLEKQLYDGITGIWYSTKKGGIWSDSVKLVLGEGPALDGCPFVQDNTIWFCSARAGNYDEIDFWAANITEGESINPRNVGEHLNTEIIDGEIHISSDWNEIYFHSNMEGGKGELDIWVTGKENGEWGVPKNVWPINSEESDSHPFLTEDGRELWFIRWYRGYPAIFRSKKMEGEWTKPELIISQFAAEPTLDNDGNIYFVHHFIQDGVMLDADIYVSNKGKSWSPLDEPNFPNRGFYMGLLPTPGEGQSLEDVYSQTAKNCEIIPVWGRPTPYYDLCNDLGGDWGETFIESLTRNNGLVPLIHLSFIDKGLTLQRPSQLWDLNFNDFEWRQSYKDAALWAVKIVKPKFLSVGNEVNRWYEKYGLEGKNGFKHFISLYEEIYDSVKEISPETVVFCTFSREIVSENREADMCVLELFDPKKLDLLVLTTYPHSVEGINRPQDIPIDYYSSVVAKMPGKPLGFSEAAWPSMPAFGGEQAQADFLNLLTGELTIDQGVDLELLMWPWLHDLDSGDYIGLIMRNGTTKEGYRKWVEISGT